MRRLRLTRRGEAVRGGIAAVVTSAVLGAATLLGANVPEIVFQDVTAAAGIATDAPDWGFAAAADIDRDGWDDLVLNAHPGMHFYRNNRNGTFARVTPSGIPPASEATKHRHVWAFCDLDRDGDEDLVIGTGIRRPGEVDPHVDPANSEDLWLRNDTPPGGAFAFTDMTLAWGTRNLGSNVSAIGCGDLDNDGRLDVLMVESQTADGFGDVAFPLYGIFLNRLPSGFVKDPGRVPGGSPARAGVFIYSVDCGDFVRGDDADDCVTGSNQHARWVVQGFDPTRTPTYFPADGTFYVTQGEPDDLPDLSSYTFENVGAVYDFNADGRLDLLRTDYNDEPKGIMLFLGVDHPSGPRPLALGFSHLVAGAAPTTVAVGDFDNDGDPDIFVGRFGEEARDGTQIDAADFVYRNDGPDAGGNPQFTEVGVSAGLAGPFVGQFNTGAGAATVLDYDKDGRLDLVIGYTEVGQDAVFRRPILLYRNVSTVGKWIGFILRGPQRLGAVVQVAACGKEQRQLLTARTGWLSQDSRNVHFGLGACAEAVTVTIRWPDGTIQSATFVAGAYHAVTRARHTPPRPHPTPSPTPTHHR